MDDIHFNAIRLNEPDPLTNWSFGEKAYVLPRPTVFSYDTTCTRWLVDIMKKLVVSIQYLRGLAAMMVVFHHSISKIREMNPEFFIPYSGFGGAGVDIFFVISGFIMWVTTSSKAEAPANTGPESQISQEQIRAQSRTSVHCAIGLQDFGQTPAARA